MNEPLPATQTPVQLLKVDDKMWQLLCFETSELELSGLTRKECFEVLKQRHPKYDFSYNSYNRRTNKYFKDRSFLIMPDLADTLMNQFKRRYERGMAGAEKKGDWRTYLSANFEFVKTMQSIGIVPQITGTSTKMPDENIQIIDQVMKEVHKKKLDEQNAKLNTATIPDGTSGSENTGQENT